MSDEGPFKAYRNEQFLNSPDARQIRILSEYLEPKARLEEYQVSDTIVFFGSARLKARDDANQKLAAARAHGDDIADAERDIEMSRFYEDARSLAGRLTEWSKSLEDTKRRFLVCTGGGPGIMEAANRGASEADGINIGFNISLPFEQHDNPYITRELNFEFHYFFTRKFWFSYLAEAFVIMPGGFGTLDEFFEILTLIQTEKIKKDQPIVLFGKEYWSKLINFETLVDYGVIERKDLDLFFITSSVDEAYEHIISNLNLK